MKKNSGNEEIQGKKNGSLPGLDLSIKIDNVVWLPGNLPTIPGNFLCQCINSGPLGLSTLFAHLFQKKLIFVSNWGRWLWFSGNRYYEDDACRIPGLVTVLLDVMEEIRPRLQPDKDDSENIKHFKAALEKSRQRQVKFLQGARAPKDILSLAKSQIYPENGRPVFAVVAEKLNLKKNLLVCGNPENGTEITINIENGRKVEGSPEHLITAGCPTVWRGLDCPAPVFEKFLSTCHPDRPDQTEFLHRWIGYALTRKCNRAIFTILYGPSARNGKSRFIEALLYALGPELIQILKAETILKRQGSAGGSGGIDVGLAESRDKALIFMSEPERGEKIATGLVKSLASGGDTISCRRPYEVRLSSITPTASWALACNDIPSFFGDDQGFTDRLAVSLWPVHFVADPAIEPNEAAGERRADVNLADKLKEEASGILAWAVRGTLKYLVDGLKISPEIRKQTAALVNESDLVHLWMIERVDQEGETERGRLFQDFLTWIEENNIGRKWTRNAFYAGLRRKMEPITPRRPSGIFYPCTLKM